MNSSDAIYEWLHPWEEQFWWELWIEYEMWNRRVEE